MPYGSAFNSAGQAVLQPGGIHGAAPGSFFQSSVDPLQAALTQQGYQNQLKIAETSIQPGMLSEQNRMQRFNTVFPWLQGQLGNFNPGRIGGQSNFTVGGVYNPQQIQQQVNGMRATNDQSTATQNRGAAESLGGRGFGSNSPLLQAIYGQNAASNLATNTQGENQLRTTAAGQNAQQTLSSQTAASQADIERRKVASNVYSAFISALGGMA